MTVDSGDAASDHGEEETTDSGDAGSQEDVDNWITALLGVLIVAAILPIVTMALATASFGNDLEDRTLGYIVLNPVSRWSIVLSKMLAPVAIAGPALILSGVVATLIGLGGDVRTAGAVAVGLLAGIVAYSAIFVWAGLMTTHAIGFRALVRVPVGGPAQHASRRDPVPKRAGLCHDVDGGHRRVAAGCG